MLYTSAEANKLLKKLMDDRDRLLLEEEQTSVFTAATFENVEDVRPEYGFLETQDALAEIERQIRLVKHAINQFNITHYIPDTGLTIDEALVKIPQLTARRLKLGKMCKRQPKARKKPSYGEKTNFIEYEYANYNVETATQAYNQACEQLSLLQLGLDKINSTVTMEIEI